MQKKNLCGRLGLMVVVAVFLAACAAVPQKGYDHDAHAAIKTIAILQPGIPEDSNVWLAVDPGASFGLIGALVSGAVAANRTSNYMTVVKAAKFDQRNFFSNQLIAQLKLAGYDARFLDVTRDRSKAEFIQQYPAKAAGIDAYLDVYSTGIGYMAAGTGRALPYRPTAYLAVRVVSAAAGNEVLFSDQVRYNPAGPDQKVITIQPQPGYEYTDSDALVAAGPKSVEGLRLALTSVATEIAHQLH